MKYELTHDLITGNALIDSEHRQLFDAINNLLDACAQGKGRDKIHETVTFLNSYVIKHFGDEERLQLSAKYPAYDSHHTFHEGYKRNLSQVTAGLEKDGPTIQALGALNQAAAVLVSHIRTEDKKLARFLKEGK